MKEKLKKFLKNHNNIIGMSARDENGVMKAIDDFFDQYQPERSKREDLNYHALVDEFISLGLRDGIVKNLEQEEFFNKGMSHFAEFLNSSC